MQTTADHDHKADLCPLTKSEDELQPLHDTEDDAFNWLETTATAELTI